MSQKSIFKCVENKGYKITPDKEYNIVKQERNFLFLENDNGKLARYSKELFTEVQELPPVPPVPPVPTRTEIDMINSISFNQNNSSVEFLDLNNQSKTITSPLIFTTTNISCGINQCYELNGLINRINHVVDSIDGEDDYIDLRKSLLNRVIREQVINIGYGGSAMIIMSTNIDIDEDLVSEINTLASISSEVLENPNSGNMIQMWIFYIAGN